jgi:hypothetical protein
MRLTIVLGLSLPQLISTQRVVRGKPCDDAEDARALGGDERVGVAFDESIKLRRLRYAASTFVRLSTNFNARSSSVSGVVVALSNTLLFALVPVARA